MCSTGSNFWVLGVFLVLVSCKSENRYAAVPTIVVDNERNQLSLCSLATKVKVYRIPKETTYEIGTQFIKYFPFGEDILLVNVNNSEIVLLGDDGEIKWRPIPPSPGIDRYDYIGTVAIDYELNELYVGDMSNGVVDVFRVNGGYLRTVYPKQIVVDFTPFDDGAILFDVSYHDEDDNIDGTGVPKRFLLVDGETSEFYTSMVEKVYFHAVPTVHNDRFNVIGGALQHRRPHEDTVYEVSRNMNVEPVLQFSFRYNSNFREIARDPGTEYVFNALKDRGYPNPSLVIYDSAINRTYCNFWQGDGFYFTVLEDGVTKLSCGEYYKFGDTVTKAPMFYSEGTFYQQMFKYEFDFLQEVDFSTTSTFAIQSSLDSMSALKGENDDIIIIATKF